MLVSTPGTIEPVGAAARPPQQAVLLPQREVTANCLGSHIQLDGMFGHFDVSIPAGVWMRRSSR